MKIKERLCEEAPARIADREPRGQYKTSLGLTAARPVQDEPGSHCLVPLLLGGSCPPLEPSVTSTCPEGEFGVSGQVCVLIEELTALTMIKIYNFI